MRSSSSPAGAPPRRRGRARQPRRPWCGPAPAGTRARSARRRRRRRRGTPRGPRPRGRRPRGRGRPGRAASTASSRSSSGRRRWCAGTAPSQAVAVSTGRAESVLRTSARDAVHRVSVSPRRAASDPARTYEPAARRCSAAARPIARTSATGTIEHSVPCHRSWARTRPSPVWATIGTARTSSSTSTGAPHSAASVSASAVPTVARASSAPQVVGTEPADDLLPDELPAPDAVGVRAGRPDRQAHQGRPAAEPVEAGDVPTDRAGDGGDLGAGEGEGSWVISRTRSAAWRRASGSAGIARPASTRWAWAGSARTTSASSWTADDRSGSSCTSSMTRHTANGEIERRALTTAPAASDPARARRGTARSRRRGGRRPRRPVRTTPTRRRRADGCGGGGSTGPGPSTCRGRPRRRRSSRPRPSGGPAPRPGAGAAAHPTRTAARVRTGGRWWADRDGAVTWTRGPPGRATRRRAARGVERARRPEIRRTEVGGSGRSWRDPWDACP